MSASQRRKPYSRKASRKWCPDSSTNEGALGAFFRLWACPRGSTWSTSPARPAPRRPAGPVRQNTQTTWCCTFPGRQTPGQAERLQALAEVELLQLVDVATVTASFLPERSQRDALSHELVVAMLRVECLVLVDVCLAESFQLAGSEPG